MTAPVKKHLHRQRGVTLMEVLLSMGILAGLLATGTHIISKYTRLIINEKAAAQMMAVQNAAEEFVQSNFMQLLDGSLPDSIPFNGNTRLITVADLSAANYLPANFSNVNKLNLRMSVVIRNDTQVGATPSIEIITVTQGIANPPYSDAPLESVYDTAMFGKGRLGFAASGGPYNFANIVGINGQWTVPTNNLAGHGLTFAFNAAEPNAFLAGYGRVSSEDIFDDDVLYRIPVAGRPEVNQMQADLDMSGHQMDGIGTMTVDNVKAPRVELTNAGGNALTTSQTMTMRGNTSVTGHTAVYGNLTANNANMATGTVAAKNFNSNTLTANNAIGNDIATESVTSRDMIVNNAMTLDNVNVIANNVQLGGNGGNTLTTSTLGAPSMVAGNTKVRGTYTADTDGKHQVVNNLDIGGKGGIRTMAAQEVLFDGSLCWTSGGPKDGIPGC